MPPFARLAAFAACAVVFGCTSREEKVPVVVATVTPKESPKAEPKVVANGDLSKTSLIGRVTWGGDTFPPQAVANLKDNPDKAACMIDGPVNDETWIVNPKNKGLKNAFVWLEAAKKGDKLPIPASLEKIEPKKVEVDQPSCAFIAHAIALREGQILVAKNSSKIGHNFKWGGDPTVNKGGNVLLPPGASKEIDDLKANRLPVKMECNIHPWMNGWIRVFDHPYFAVTDDEGSFTIANAPVGEFRLKVWHGSGGWLGGSAGANGQPVTIGPGDNQIGSLPYPPPKS